MGDSYSDRHITQRYMQRYGNTARVRSWAGKMVHIRTENGVWRTGGCGYTCAGKPDAWVLPFEEAVKRISHCGPEKHGAFILAEPEALHRPEDDAIEALEADAALHEHAAAECRRAVKLMRDRQRLGDVRRALRSAPNPAPEE